jgi:hypothetical protein
VAALHDDGLRGRIAAGGRATAAGFTWAAAAEAHEELYARIAGV